jgi:hypothetical protein
MQRNMSSFSLCHDATLSTKVQCDQAIAYRSTRAICSSDTWRNRSHLLHSKPTTAKDSLNRRHVAADCRLQQACITEENPLLAKCLLVYPVFDECDVTRHPFHFTTMQHYQQRSDETKQLLINQPEQYTLVTLGETDLICHIANPQKPKIGLNR